MSQRSFAASSPNNSGPTSNNNSNATLAADYSVAESLLRQASTMVEQLERGVCIDAAPVTRLLDQATAAVQTQLGRLQTLSQSNAYHYMNSNDGGGAAVFTAAQQRKGANLLSECDTLRQAVQRASVKTQRAMQAAKDREALLTGGGPSRLDLLRAQQTGIQHLSNEESALNHTRRKIQQMTSESDSLLTALRGQGQRLTRTHSRAEEILEVLGVSNHTLRSIARTNRVDAWLVYIGVALTLLLMWYIWTSS